MNIPNYALFELGFGYKYQYLMSALLHTLISENINFELSEKYIKKKLLLNTIHANSKKFIWQIEKIILDRKELEYKRNSLIMLEGENRCFEDINLFTTNNGISKIHFFQVKGSMAKTSKTILDNAVIKTLVNTLENQNIQISFQLIILLNRGISNHFFMNSINDKAKIIISVIKTLKLKDLDKKRQKKLYRKFLEILEKYVYISYLFSTKIYNSKYIFPKMKDNSNCIKVNNITDFNLLKNYNDIYLFFLNEDKRNFMKYKNIIDNNSLFESILNLKKILNKTTVIEQLDYRLIYMFLQYIHGNNKLNKLLWNIEMQSMNGKKTEIKMIKNQLNNISFDENYINKLKFSKKSSTKFKIGKIL